MVLSSGYCAPVRLFLCSKLKWFPARGWVKCVPTSRWINLPMVRQRQKLIENKGSVLPAMKEWNWRTFLHGTPELEMKTQLLVNFAAEDGVRQHSKRKDFDPIRKRRKCDTWLLSPYFSSKWFENLFRPIKERRNDKPRRYKLVCKVMWKRLYHNYCISSNKCPTSIKCVQYLK